MATRAKTVTAKATGMSDEAVKAGSGKSWDEWFALLDRAGAAKMTHSAIAAYLADKHELPSWWSQMVAVGYERARGIRDKHEKADGYQISVTRTIAVPVAKAYKAWVDKRMRNKWLPETTMEIRTASENKSLRITWSDGTSNLDVDFSAKGESKCSLSVEHSKLKDAKAAARMKATWAKTLDWLKELLEED